MIKQVTSLFYRTETLNKIDKKIKLLGIDKKYDLITFMNLRIVSTIIIFLLLFYLLRLGYILAPVLAFLYYKYLPDLYFKPKIKERKRKLDREALYFFEIMALSLESGNNLTNALDLTSKSIDSDLAKEFRQVILEVEYGKSLEEALDSLKSRIPSETINNIVLNIKESDLFGNNIVDTLYNQIDYIREKIVLENRAYISKLPLKISIISVLFFVPLLLLIILGPVLIRYFLG